MKKSLLRVLQTPSTENCIPTGGQAVVIDVLRATTTMVTAVYNGAKGVWPVISVEEARALCPPGAILAGERDGLPPQGFTLGNSPLEFTPGTVKGKEIWLTTTNGTLALKLASEFAEPICLAFSNLSDTCEHLLQRGEETTVVCSGSRGLPCEDDFFLAGALVARLKDHFHLSDSAVSALKLYDSHLGDPSDFLKQSKHGRRLIEQGFERDVEYCGQVDLCPLVVQMNEEGSYSSAVTSSKRAASSVRRDLRASPPEM